MILRLLFVKSLELALPQYQQGDPFYPVVYAIVAGIVILVLGLALVASMRNPKMMRTKKENY